MSGPLVCQTALCTCSMGTAPAPLNPLPSSGVLMTPGPMGTIADNISFANITPFAMCTSMLNPAVLSATIAAFGVLTPMPCTPMPPAPWIPSQGNLIGQNSMPALDSGSQLVCAYGGMITITFPGQVPTIVS